MNSHSFIEWTPAHFIEFTRLRFGQLNTLLCNDMKTRVFNFALILPVRLRAVASGLMMLRVRSVAMMFPFTYARA